FCTANCGDYSGFVQANCSLTRKRRPRSGCNERLSETSRRASLRDSCKNFQQLAHRRLNRLRVVAAGATEPADCLRGARAFRLVGNLAVGGPASLEKLQLFEKPLKRLANGGIRGCLRLAAGRATRIVECHQSQVALRGVVPGGCLNPLR